MANDPAETGISPELQKHIDRLGKMAANESGQIYASQAEIQAILAGQLSKDIKFLSGVISASASQMAGTTNVIKEAVEKFDASAKHEVNHLAGALYAFRDSMDKSSRQMWWLTLWLVVFTALLVVFTAVLAFKDLGIFPAKATVRSVTPELRQLNR